MKNYFALIPTIFLFACATKDIPEDTSAKAESSQTIKVTGRRIKKSDLPPGPMLNMKVNKENKNSNILTVLAESKTLLQPKVIGDCRGLLMKLSGTSLQYKIVDSNKVILRGEHGVYEYTFDDGSCPVNET